ncbi:MAG: CPBP family intramembrane metalloprotease [Bdellovibrionales bacterium]|nr:CPBP family intramembrane metalloprotease [Bdellovibrionales bacterium]
MSISPVLTKALGFDRIRDLVDCFRHETANSVHQNVRTVELCGAILISIVPCISFSWFKDRSDVDFVTFAVGLAACLAVLYRVRLGIRFPSVGSWKETLKHVHTAFALGCIPFVFLSLLFPELFSSVVAHKDAATSVPGVEQTPSLAATISFVLGVAVWAGLTEEIIYRGLLVSVLRRWEYISTQFYRDLFAIVVSAMIFGFGHLALWGPGMALALVGLGLGFGFAYIAIGEKLLPLVVYHILFDTVSLSVSIFVL